MLVILISFLFQINNTLIGSWQQVTDEDTEIKDIVEFKIDSVIFVQQFFSENSYEIKDNILKIMNDRNEVIIENKFSVVHDTLFLIKKDKTDKMFRVTDKDGKNKIIGEWAGKTNTGILTFFNFKDTNTVFYKAVLNRRKFGYERYAAHIAIQLKEKDVQINYIIDDGYLTLIYPDAKEKFKYKRK